MGDKVTILFGVILIGAMYHLIRDVLQIAGVENALTEIGHRSHEWCGVYCNYVTLPIDIFVVIASIIVIKRKKIGLLGVGILIALLIALFMWAWQ